jgi:folate-dependent phosphoribosylglycinamide formyltransferase PurN
VSPPDASSGSGVCVLAQPCDATSIITHALTEKFGPVDVVLEGPVDRVAFLKARARRLGWFTVAGQVLFMAVAEPVIRRRGARRVAAIVANEGLRCDTPLEAVQRVPSVNTDEARALLRSLNPKVVVVSGTRIISEATLACVDAPFINMHAGITPQYRGVHGAYWALAERRPDLAGTTVHLVDTGIDTGNILGQATITPTKHDSFATYPYLQTAVGIPILIDAVATVLSGQVPPTRPPMATEPSRLRSHPTLWSYVAKRLRGVR